MSLKQWASNGWLRAYETSLKEIEDLLALVKRDLADATGDISTDWQLTRSVGPSCGCPGYRHISLRRAWHAPALARGQGGVLAFHLDRGLKVGKLLGSAALADHFNLGRRHYLLAVLFLHRAGDRDLFG